MNMILVEGVRLIRGLGSEGSGLARRRVYPLEFAQGSRGSDQANVSKTGRSVLVSSVNACRITFLWRPESRGFPSG